jgi:hypothetical protein
MTLTCAFFKGGSNQNTLYSKAIKKYTRGIYSHMELWDIPSGKRYSSSSDKKGVFMDSIETENMEEWDLLEINIENITIKDLHRYYLKTNASKYDYLGIFGFILPIKDREDRWFCSEWCCNFLKNSGVEAFELLEASRISPNKAYKIIKNIKQ